MNPITQDRITGALDGAIAELVGLERTPLRAKTLYDLEMAKLLITKESGEYKVNKRNRTEEREFLINLRKA